jgi:outer membrane protein TolC
LNNKIAITDFEISVTNYLRDVEMQYGKLYLAYQKHQVELDNKQDAERILGIVQARRDASGSELTRVVEAREGTLMAEQRVLEALDEVYNQESEMRLLMGLTLQNERMIYPIDPPVTAEMKLDWNGSLGTALTRRPELRRQKAAVKSAELQLIAAENLDRPRLDLLASAQSNGFGNDLLGSRSAPGTTLPLGSAYDRLLRFNQTGWNLGVEYSQPLGLRFANQQVKNNELKLIKAMTILQAQEADILHQMTAAFQTVDRTFLAMKNQELVVKNAEDRMAAAEADYNSNKDGRGYLDLDSLNRARDIYAQAYVKLGQSKLEYSMALTDIEYRCGRLLEYHNVMLGESPESAMSPTLMTTPIEAPQKGPELAPPPVPDEDQKPQPPPAAVPPPEGDITDLDSEGSDPGFVSVNRSEPGSVSYDDSAIDVAEELFPPEEIEANDWTRPAPDDKIQTSDTSSPRDDSWTRDGAGDQTTRAEAASTTDQFPWANDSPVEEASPQ